MKFEPVDIILKDGSIITLREAAVEDAEQLRTAAKEYLTESEYIPYSEGEFNLTLEEEEQIIQSFLEQENFLLMLAVYQNQVIGCLNVNGDTKKMMKHGVRLGIGMLKEWRGKGVGSAMFEYMIKWAKEKTSIELLWLETLASNEAGQCLYRKFGFEQTGIIPKQIKFEDGSYADTIIMSLIIK